MQCCGKYACAVALNHRISQKSKPSCLCLRNTTVNSEITAARCYCRFLALVLLITCCVPHSLQYRHMASLGLQDEAVFLQLFYIDIVDPTKCSCFRWHVFNCKYTKTSVQPRGARL